MTTESTRLAGVVESAARGILLLALVSAAFAATWSRVAAETTSGSGSAMLLAAPAGALLTVVALAWRRRPELAIHDRQSDKIVGTTVLVVALLVQWLILPRYAGSYVLIHLDVAATWLFALGGCVLVFGLRRTSRYWPAWAILAVASPGAIRLAVFSLGGGPWAKVAVIAVVMLAGPVAVVVGAVRSRSATRARWTGPAVTAREAWRSVPLLLVVAVALWFAPLPAVTSDRLVEGPPGQAGERLIIPAGWTERSAESFPWAPRMYGPSSTLGRQLIRADGVRADWDPLLRPRQAVVQTLTVSDPGVLDAYPLEMTFDLTNARVSQPTTIALTDGVTARYRTVVDDERLLTWSLVSFVWTRSPDRIQRVSILTVDNHEYDAEFPETAPGTRSTFVRLISLLLRGSASITATETQSKDLDMLTELGSDLVEAQWPTQ